MDQTGYSANQPAVYTNTQEQTQNATWDPNQAYMMQFYDPTSFQAQQYSISNPAYYASYVQALAQQTMKRDSRDKGIPPGFDERSCRSLYIGNIHEKVVEGLLFDIFSMFGPIESCKLIKDKNTGLSAGYGFVDYFEHGSAAAALQNIAGKLLYGLEIKVNWAFASGQKEDTTGHFHIFVGDLSPDIDDKALQTAFSPFGGITDARVMWDQSSGRSRGYGFVAFRRREDAQKALTEMNGEWLGNRQIRCNWANQKGSAGLPEEMQFNAAPQPQYNSGLDYATIVSQGGPTNTTVYVGNVSAEVSEHQLRSLFIQYGLLEEIKLQADKGFAFVRYQTHEQAAKAIVGTHGRVIGNGRPIRCSWGKERAGPSGVPMPEGVRRFP